MSLGKKCRHIWHDLYYAWSGDGGMEFAMRCRDVAQQIDLNGTPQGFRAKIRYFLHLSLCQACKNYFDFSRFLHRQAHQLIKTREPSSAEIEKINANVIHAFQKKS